MDNGQHPPMTDEDFAALAAFAGPLYQESRTVESYISESPIPGSHRDNGSLNIRQGLEQAQRMAQASRVRPEPVYVPPAIPMEQPSIPDPVEQPHLFDNGSTAVPTQFNPQLPTPDPSDQLEFSFDPKEQEITNKHLSDISKKLTTLISLLEKSTKEDTMVPKSKRNAKNNQV